MPFVRTISATLLFLSWLLPAKAHAELRLETWNSYGQLAEQGAICASFSALMESQSVLNPDLGALWQERRKFAGAVIRKAVMLELNRDSTEPEINQLIAGYRDWVLSSLMIDADQETDSLSSDSASAEASGAKKIRALVNSQCKSLFEQGDEMIRQQKPELAYLLDDTASPAASQQAPASEETGPRRKLTNTPAPLVTAKANTPDTPEITHNLSKAEVDRVDGPATNLAKTGLHSQPEPQNNKDQQNKEVQLSIGGGNSFTLTLPGKTPPVKAATAAADKPASPLQITKTPDIPKLADVSGPAARPERPPQNQPDISSPPKMPSDQKKPEEPAQTDIAASTELIPMPPKQTQKTSADTAANSTFATEQPAAAPVFDLLDQQANAHVNLATPFQIQNNDHTASEVAYFAQLGAFSRLENATAEKQRLEQKFTTLFEKLPLDITEVNNAGPRFYRIRTPDLNQRQTKAVCDLLWPHRIACLVKSAKSQ